ncbi:hypothetical protein EPN96_02125 [bacterium]|nr:MAG: hypothetical protein EPN96_02125 [bacterium]
MARPAGKNSIAVFLAAVLLFGGGLSFALETGTQQQTEKSIYARLRLDSILKTRSDSGLLAYYNDKNEPANFRAQALETILKDRPPPLSTSERILLQNGLAAPEPEIRTISARLIGTLKETALIRQVLEMADSDPDPGVKAEALITTRPWTKISHLYFLEKAVESESLKVRVEGVNSLGNLSAGELNPAIVGRVETFMGQGNPPELRKAAMGALYVWKRLEWEDLRDTMLDPGAPEGLRIYAMELSDKLPQALRVRMDLLRDVATSETSLRFVWQAFRRIKNTIKNDLDLNRSLAKLLSTTTQSNTAVDEIANYLKAQGYTLLRRDDGGWLVRGI